MRRADLRHVSEYPIACASDVESRAGNVNTWPKVVYLDVPSSPGGVQTGQGAYRPCADDHALETHGDFNRGLGLPMGATSNACNS